MRIQTLVVAAAFAAAQIAAAESAPASAAPPEKTVFADDFRSAGEFSFGTVHPGAPGRTENWAVKITEMPDSRLLMVWCSESARERVVEQE